MKALSTRHLALIVLGVVTMALVGCDRMDVGYLKTENASFSPDTVYAYRNIDPNSDRALNGSPWTSVRIQGVSGTAPVNYAYDGVTAKDGGSAEAFDAMARDGKLVIQGGLVQLFQEGVERIPNGVYTISIRVSNQDHEALLKDIFTFVVAENDPTYFPSGEEYNTNDNS